MRYRMTFRERKLWKPLRTLDANFRRQMPLGRFFVDFGTHNPPLVIEIDGPVHEVFADVALRDIERQAWLESQGYTVMRFTTRQVDDDLESCVEKVKQQLALLLDGGGLGGGVREATVEWRDWSPAPSSAQGLDTLHPPSPTLPPSRRKGARLSTDTRAGGEAR